MLLGRLEIPKAGWEVPSSKDETWMVRSLDKDREGVAGLKLLLLPVYPTTAVAVRNVVRRRRRRFLDINGNLASVVFERNK
jgi:hypothetical protein